jgi:hypothetical protein
VIRIFNVYYPVRTLILILGEALLVLASFLLVTVLQYREDSYLVLNFEHGYSRIAILTVFVVLLSYWLDLYQLRQPSPLGARGEFLFQAILITGLLTSGVGLVSAIVPGNPADARDLSLVLGSSLATLALLAWRSAYSWLAAQPFLKERVYVLGTGTRALALVEGLRSRAELGIDVVGWTGELTAPVTREETASHLGEVVNRTRAHRVILAMQDRRHAMPVEALLELRVQTSIQIEDAASWLERISGKIELDHLYPSWIIFARGFRFSGSFRLLRRLLNIVTCVIGLLVALPLIPFVILAIRLDSPGPVLYRQKRAAETARLFSATNSERCARMPKPITGPLGRETTIPESRGSADSFAELGSTKFRNYGACSRVTWPLWVHGRNVRNSLSGSRVKFPTTAFATWCDQELRVGHRSATSTEIPLKMQKKSSNTIFSISRMLPSDWTFSSCFTQ